MTDWKPIKTAPFRKVVWVRNKMMTEPVKATRGYATESGVHPDDTFFTNVYTEDDFFPMAAGKLVCPEEWTDLEDYTPE